MDARAVGIAAWRLGAGRARKEDPVSAAAGIECLKKLGEEVERGEPVLELHSDDPGRFDSAVEALADAVEIGPEAPEATPMILERIGP
jgi:thymidine phosphorylase